MVARSRKRKSWLAEEVETLFSLMGMETEVKAELVGSVLLISGKELVPGATPSTQTISLGQVFHICAPIALQNYRMKIMLVR